MLIQLCVDDPDYFPTSTNWHVPVNASRAFAAMGETHIFEPLNVFASTGRRLDPSLFSRKLPGALVEVHFDLHHWYFAKDKFDSFNAHPKQVIIIREGANSAGHRLKKKPIRGIRRDEPPKGTNKVESEEAARVLSEGTTEASVSSRKRKFGEEGGIAVSIHIANANSLITQMLGMLQRPHLARLM